MQFFAFNLSQKNLPNTGSRFNPTQKIADLSSFLGKKNLGASTNVKTTYPFFFFVITLGID
jgi:hypothetical protein